MSGDETKLKSGNGQRRFLLRFLNGGALAGLRLRQAGERQRQTGAGTPAIVAELWWAPIEASPVNPVQIRDGARQEGSSTPHTARASLGP